MSPTNRSARPGVSFIEAIKLGFKRYVDFDGRSSLSEYWWWQLTVFIAVILLGLLLQVSEDPYGNAPGVVDALIYIGFFGTVVPTIALTIRRLHDTGRSGLSILWNLLPFVGGLMVLIATARQPSRAGDRFNSLGGVGVRTAARSHRSI